MGFYITLYLIGVFGTLIILNSSNKSMTKHVGQKEYRMNIGMKVYFIGYCGLLLLLSCLRYGLGTDYFLYRSNFYGTADWWQIVDIRGIFGGLINIYTSLHLPFQAFISSFAIFSLLIVFVLIDKYSWNPLFSISILIGLSYYSFSLSGFRQFTAIVILIYSVHINCIREKKRTNIKVTILFLLIASSIHRSSFAASIMFILLFYWNPKKQTMLKINCVGIIMFIVTKIFINKINQLIFILVSLSGYYSNYLNYTGEQYFRLYSQGTSLFNTILLIPCMFFTYHIISEYNDGLLNTSKFMYTLVKIFYFYQIVLCLNMSSETVDRFLFYFSITSVFVYPMFVKYTHAQYGKKNAIYLCIFLLSSIGYMFFRYLSINAYGIIPYKWIL